MAICDGDQDPLTKAVKIAESRGRVCAGQGDYRDIRFDCSRATLATASVQKTTHPVYGQRRGLRFTQECLIRELLLLVAAEVRNGLRTSLQPIRWIVHSRPPLVGLETDR